MPSKLRNYARRGGAFSLGGAALLLASAASAQTAPTAPTTPALPPLSPAEVSTLPPEYRNGPAMADRTERTIGADGVETITRTRYISAPQPMPMAQPMGAPMAQGQVPMQPMAYGYSPQPVGYGYAAAQQPVVFDRTQWIEECRRRTAGQGRNKVGTIIGGLLGAIGGGIGGNLLAGAGDKVLGTVIGAVGGGLGGGLIGSLFNGRKRGTTDCETALNEYMSQGTPVPMQRFASREIPMAPAYAYAPAYAPAYAYAPQPAYAYAPAYAPPAYGYLPAQQVVVPVQSQQPQQVVVRETVREEVVPGATRSIPAPRPGKLIKLR